MTFDRQKLFDAVRSLVVDGDLNLRLIHAAGHLIEIDDDDVPGDMLAEFERVRDPLIQMPMVSRGKMLPRDLEPSAARAAAQGARGLPRGRDGRPVTLIAVQIRGHYRDELVP